MHLLEPHIGHAYSLVLADTIKRWHQLRDGLEGPTKTPFNLFTGTDEYGQKVYEAAKAVGCEPKEWADKIHVEFKTLATILGIQPTRCIRTTDTDHMNAVKHLWKRLQDSGDIYKGKHSGWYCVSDERFYAEHETEQQLIINMENGKKEETITRRSKESKKLVKWVEEENYMFRLCKYRDRIIKWLNSGMVIHPEGRKNDLWSFLNANEEVKFDDLSVSRCVNVMKWGIPVPDDPSQMIYVWLDALTNYLTCNGYPQIEQCPNIHVIGKDIAKFHIIYWPAFLMAAGIALPEKLIVHGHWTSANIKMSKSLGNVINPSDLVEKYGIDTLRYYLLRNSKLDSDSNFSIPEMIAIANGELSNQLGNLLSRAFNEKFLNTTLSVEEQELVPDKKVVEEVKKCILECKRLYDDYNFGAGLERLQSILHLANGLFSKAEPWNLLGSKDQIKLRQLLYDVAYICLAFAIMSSPIVPDLSQKIIKMLHRGQETSLTFSSLIQGKSRPTMPILNENNTFPLRLPMIPRILKSAVI